MTEGLERPSRVAMGANDGSDDDDVVSPPRLGRPQRRGRRLARPCHAHRHRTPARRARRFPVFTANFVGGLEIVGGLLLILGLGTRLITIPFIIEMLVAILSTKPRLFLGTLPLPPPPVPPQVGIWAVLHEVRSEYAQIMSCLFLLISGPGPWSLDTSLLCGEQGKRDGTGRFCVYTPDPISPVSWRL